MSASWANGMKEYFGFWVLDSGSRIEEALPGADPLDIVLPGFSIALDVGDDEGRASIDEPLIRGTARGTGTSNRLSASTLSRKSLENRTRMGKRRLPSTVVDMFSPPMA